MILNLLFYSPTLFIAVLLAILCAFTIHEFSHAFAAYLLGDNTAKDYGRLTLNPLAHIDVLGFLLLLMAGFGWGKPVPYNPYNLRNKRYGSAIVGLAGPGANLICVFLFGYLFKFLSPIVGPHNLLSIFLMFLVIYNATLMIFNLIPIPPLDGSKILLTLLPPQFNYFKIMLITRGPFILLVLVLLSSLLGLPIFDSLFNGVINLCQKMFGRFPLM